MQKYKIIIGYDGTDYHGWQRQPNRKTIQGTLERALAKITGESTSITGAGRTDAGVHALGQTAHFQTGIRISGRDFTAALNALLPGDIRIRSLRKAPEEFHARRSARSKIYRYRILNSREISPFDFRYVLWWKGHLDTGAMRRASALFVRKADFTPFSSNRLLYPVRTVYRTSLIRRGPEIRFTIEADGFLRYMVRAVVGTLLEVGRGRVKAGDIDGMFREGRRRLSSPTAPPKGLCLMRVIY